MRKLLEAPLQKEGYNQLNFIIETTMKEIMKLNEAKEEVTTDKDQLSKKTEMSNNFISLTNTVDEVIENLLGEDEENLEEISSAGGGSVQGYSKNINDI